MSTVPHTTDTPQQQTGVATYTGRHRDHPEYPVPGRRLPVFAAMHAARAARGSNPYQPRHAAPEHTGGQP